MFRNLLQKVALCSVSVLLCLGSAEFVLRLSGSFPVVGLHSVSARDYDRIPGLWEPGQDFVNRLNPALPHRIRTNSLGLRGPDTTLEPRGLRVLCLGDSFTFGDYVNDEETLPALLGDRLRGTAEVLNGGVGGTSIVDQREFMKRYLVLRPDVVVLVFYDNDLNDLLTDPPLHVVFARNRELKSGILAPIYDAVRDTASFNALLYVQGAMRAKRADAVSQPASATDAASGVPPPWLAPMVDRYSTEAAALRDMLETHGIELVVTAFPDAYFVSGRFPLDRIGPMSRALEARQMHVIDLIPALRVSGLPVTDIYLLPHDGHPSPRGYAIAAQALEPHVRQALEKHAERVSAHFSKQPL